MNANFMQSYVLLFWLILIWNWGAVSPVLIVSSLSLELTIFIETWSRRLSLIFRENDKRLSTLSISLCVKLLMFVSLILNDAIHPMKNLVWKHSKNWVEIAKFTQFHAKINANFSFSPHKIFFANRTDLFWSFLRCHQSLQTLPSIHQPLRQDVPWQAP